MARPKTPTNILEAKGAFKINPERRNKNEPIVTDPFPKVAPEHLEDGQKSCWHEIVKTAPAGVLTAADVLIVEMIARLLSEYRKKGEKFCPSKLTRLSAEYNRIGLSPSSRAGLSVEKPK